jgi:PAS domain S-box-containing protein
MPSFVSALLLILALLTPCSAFAKTLRVGIYQNSPKVFVDDNGTPKGIFVDVLDEIARKENWKIDYVYGTWAENISRLKANEIDLLVDVSFSEERAKEFNLSRTPVLESWLDVYSKKEFRIGSIRDLDKKKIAVLAGSIQETYLHEKIKTTFSIDFTLLPYRDYPSSVNAVKSGEADVMVATRFFSFSPLRDEDIVPAHVIFRQENLYFAFPGNSNTDLSGIIDRHIAAMRNDPGSAYYRSLLRWLNIHPRALVPVYIRYALATLTGVLIMIGLFAFCLRRQVASKTLALEETHRLLGETQSVAGLGGWEYDVKTRRIKWTDEVYRIYGVDRDYDPGDMSRDRSFYSPQDAPVIEKAFQSAVETGAPYDFELELIRRGGERIWVRTMSRPVMENGKVVRVTGYIMNITGDKQAEAEKQKLQEQLVMAQKMELIGRLAGGIAHDFNNMLCVILFNAEVAMAELKPDQPLYAELRGIYDAAMRSKDITRQLLAFARKQTINPEVLDLNEAVGEMIKLLRRLIGENIRLSWQPGVDLWLIKMDPSQLDQILANLCVNARDAIPKSGKVVIKTEKVVLDKVYCSDHEGSVPGEYVLLAVSDNGCGMDKDTLDMIFEPFFTTKGVGQGTGLGLATVHGIVKQNNGHIDVCSEPEKGTTFNIYLPRHAGGAGETRMRNADEKRRGSGETILLVEDDASILKLISGLLGGLGYIVLPAGSPGEAMRLAESTGDIHLLITDVIMPEINGRELAERINATRPEMKCLFMSGYTADVIGTKDVSDKGVHFIQKPFSAKMLSVKVRTVLEASQSNVQ